MELLYSANFACYNYFINGCLEKAKHSLQIFLRALVDPWDLLRRSTRLECVSESFLIPAEAHHEGMVRTADRHTFTDWYLLLALEQNCFLCCSAERSSFKMS
jgi:hypothetical protein